MSKQMMSRRVFLKITGIGAAGAALAACSTPSAGTTPAPADDGEKTKLVQWYHQYGEEGCQEAAGRYAAEYSTVEPNVAVEMVWVPGDYQAKLSPALLTEEGPDVFEGHLSPDMVKAGQVVDLDDLFTEELKKDFNPADMEQCMLNGKIYAVKMIQDVCCFYYKKSAFGAAGVQPPATFDDLVSIVTKLTDDKVKGLFIGNDSGLNDFQAGRYMLWASGFGVIKDQKIDWGGENAEHAGKAFAKYGELVETDGLLTGSPTDWWDPQSFIDGLCNMQMCGLWAMPAIQKALGDDVDIFAWPPVDDNGTTTINIGGWMEFVNAKSKNIDAAKKFVKWLWIDNIEAQQDWALSYGFHIPPRNSAAASADKLKSGAAKKVWDLVLEFGHPEGPYFNGTMGTAVTTAVTNIVREGKDATAEAEAAAAACQAELDNLLS